MSPAFRRIMRTLSLSQAEIRIFADPTHLSRGVADEVHQQATAALSARGRFTLALSGGSTPKAVYSLLAQDEKAGGGRLDWTKIHVFFGDERCVPADHSDSNYRMASEALLSHVPIPEENVHRVRTELEPGAAAAAYEREIVATFGTGEPRFDLILLGLGTDGHTASLFPQSSALEERKALVCATRVEKLNAHRITFTFPLINAAHSVMFITAGADKAPMLRNILRGDPSGTRYPAQDVRPASGQLRWFTDEAAARDL